MIPLYSWPGPIWDSLISVVSEYPNVPVIAISGPGGWPWASGENAEYYEYINKLKAAGIKNICYVATNSSARSQSSMQTELNDYKTYYPNYEGVFFDEMANTEGHETYYTDICNYARSLGFTFCVGNPGVNEFRSYLPTLDLINIYESSGLITVQDHMDLGIENRGQLSFIIHSQPTWNESYAAQAVNVMSYFYQTEDGPDGNPYDSLSAYYAEQMEFLNKLDTPPSTGSAGIPMYAAILIIIMSAIIGGLVGYFFVPFLVGKFWKKEKETAKVQPIGQNQDVTVSPADETGKNFNQSTFMESPPKTPQQNLIKGVYLDKSVSASRPIKINPENSSLPDSARLLNSRRQFSKVRFDRSKP